MRRATASAFDLKGQGIDASSHPIANPLDLSLRQANSCREALEPQSTQSPVVFHNGRVAVVHVQSSA